ncbi:MAG: NYN domain-containing protein [Nitrospirales bacterium]|nr:NYN domain-containing protein [Nitrospira sp.]MDR4499907.1 NYN domain-containing protein [Nitrospirales bacterium]
MSRHIIVDGYNLLGVQAKGALNAGQAGESAREALLLDLATYRHRVGHTMTVVFDAWRQHGATQQQEHRAGLTVVFTRQGEQADQVIQRLVRAEGHDCVVVSSDHEILNTARAYGAFVLRSQEFLQKLRHRSHSTSTLRSIDSIVTDDEAPRTQRLGKKGNPRKLPKAIRQRLRNLKKF